MKKSLKDYYNQEVIKDKHPKPLEIIREYLDDEIVKINIIEMLWRQ